MIEELLTKNKLWSAARKAAKPDYFDRLSKLQRPEYMDRLFR